MKLSPYFDFCVFSLNLPDCWQGLFVYSHFVLVSTGFVSTHKAKFNKKSCLCLRLVLAMTVSVHKNVPLGELLSAAGVGGVGAV